MSVRGFLSFAGLVFAAAWPLVAPAQRPVRLTDDVLQASALAVPVDPATLIDPAELPRDIGRRTLEPLGLTEEQLAKLLDSHL